MNGSGSGGGMGSRLAGRAVWLLTVLLAVGALALALGPFAFPPDGGQTARAAEVIDPAALRLLDAQTRVTLSSFRQNRATQTYLGTATVANTSPERLDAPLYLVVAAVSPAGASMVGATGLTTAGQPYYDLTALLPGGALATGATSNPLALQMKNPSGAAIQLTLHVYGPAAADQAPVADAGPDQTAGVGDRVILDGSASHDPDGDRLTFAWAFAARPADSAATLSDPTAVDPRFDLDRPGDYDIDLVVNDGNQASAPDRVRISTVNSSPVADAGPDQTAPVGAAVTLDGSRSHDVDGDRLSYLWTLTVPADSTATLDDPTAVLPRFTIDRPGEYVGQLVVDDGRVKSAPDPVTVTTENTRPVADAGPDQAATVGAAVALDGSRSHDVDGDPLTYRWSLASLPPGSTATLADPTTATPSVPIDRPGLYVAQLIVRDGHGDSDPDNAVVTTENARPVACPGPDRDGFTGDEVLLDGRCSRDPDGDPLTFQWALLHAPAGSTAALDAVDRDVASLLPDRPGLYLVQLVVGDGELASAPATARVQVAAGQHPPTITSTPRTTATATQLYTYDVEATDPDAGEVLTYALAIKPDGMTIDPASGLIAWTPPQAGGANVKVRVTDPGGLFAEQSFTITVAAAPPPANHAPTITSAPVTAATAGQPYTYDVDATDPDAGDVLTYSLPTAPQGMTINSTSGLIQWTPTAAQVGAHPVTVRVTDAGGLSVEQSFSVTVGAGSPTNQPPTLSAVGIAPQWTQLAPQGPLPSARARAGSAYDSINDRLIVFGGEQVDGAKLNDVWVLVNATGAGGAPAWVQLAPTGGPPTPRHGGIATYDSTANRLIIYGGCSSNCAPALGDAWVLTNANGLGGTPQWIQLPSTAVSSVAGAAYDPISNRMMVFGGLTAAGPFSDLSTVRVLVDANGIGEPRWIDLTPSGTLPPPRSELQNVVYDPTSNRLIVFGGYRWAGNIEYNDTWVLTNANGLGGVPEWQQLIPQGTPPSVRGNLPISYDPNSNRLIIFGGINQSSERVTYDDSWVLTHANGIGGPSEWIKLQPTGPLPTGRRDYVGAYDARINRLIAAFGANTVFGTTTTGTTLNDAWLLSNASGLCTAGQPCTFQATASDPDAGDTLTYALDTAPTGMTIDATSGAMVWTPAIAQIGDHPVTVRVTDRGGLTATQTFTATVAPVAVPNVVGLAPEWAESFISAADLTAGTKTSQGGAITLNFNSLPSRQGWVYEDPFNPVPEDRIFSLANGRLNQNSIGIPMTGHDDNAYRMDVDISPRLLFAVEMTARVLEEQSTYSFGFCFEVLTKPRVFGVGIGQSGLLAQGTPASLGSTTVAQFHTYRLVGSGSSEFIFSLDGEARATGIGSPAIPPLANGYIVFGDCTGGNNARAEIAAYSFTQPRVVGQNPPAGTLTSNQTAVDLTIVDGPATETVPDLTGLTQAQASAAILAANLTVGVVSSAPSATIPVDQISDQSPLPNIHVPKNTPVNIVMSTGPPNRAPTITSTPVTAATAGQPYAYDVDATDPDAGDVLTYSLPTAPAGMTINATSGLIQWIPTAAQVGNPAITVRVTDPGGLFAEQSFTVTVTVPSSNHAPSITSTPTTTATAGQPYRYDVEATDPDAGDVLTYSLTTFPAGMTIDAASGLTQWTPTADQIGAHDVTVWVRDQAGGGVDQSYTLSVAVIPPPLNQPPVVTSDPAVPRWQALVPLGSLPQLRYGAANTYTDERDRLVLLGGVDSTTSVFLGDVWIAEHASGVGGLPFWSMVQSQGDVNPEARMASTIVYDWLTDSIIAHGGCSENCTHQFGDAWLLMNLNISDGHPIWHRLVSAPTARMDHVAGYDPQTKRMIVYGNASIDSTDIIFNSRQDFPAGIFQSEFDPSVIEDPVSVIAVDLNLDNHIDLVTTNINSNTVSVLLGRQGGAFGDQKTFSTDVEPMQIAVADFNRDGFPDVATGNSQNSTVSVLLGKGDGGFLPRIDLVGSVDDAESLAIGDFNLDGNPDIVARDDGRGGPLSVFLGNGDGQFSPPITILINADHWVAEVASADLNSDGNPDVIAVTDSGISILLGRGDGTFQTENDFAITDCDTGYNGWSSLTVGDLNLDGIPDVIVGRPCNAIFVFLGHGNGYFENARKTSIAGGDPFAVVISDMNSDGFPDLVSRSFSSISIFLGDGSGSFSKEQYFAIDSSYTRRGYPYDASNALAVADVNDDGAKDIITTNYDAATISVLFQRPVDNGLWVLDLKNGADAAYWSALLPTGSPPPLNWRVMSGVYDPQSNRLIIMGSATSDRQNFEDVWILENANGIGQQPKWTKKATFGKAPTPRAGHSVVYDHTDGRVVLFGGQDALGQFLSDVWILTGFNDETSPLTWSQIFPVGESPSPRASHIAAYSHSYNRMLIQGGQNSLAAGSLSNDSWALILKPLVVAPSENYIYLVSAEDPNPGDKLSFSLDVAPSGMSIDRESGLVQWTPTPKQLGAHEIIVKVEDQLGASSLHSFTLVVKSPNGQPIITSTPLIASTAGQLYSYDADATDPDRDPLTYALTASPTGMTVAATTGLIQWTPAAAQTGPHPVTVRVEDGRGGFATQSFTVTVAGGGPNAGPVITSTPPTGATIGQLYTYAVEATDPDGDPLSYALTTRPTGMTLDAATGLIQWTPTAAQVGDHPVALTVADGRGGVTPQSYTLRVPAVPGTIPVPNVVGLAQAAATTALQQAGLTLGTVTTQSSATVPAGRVIGQTPAAGAQVAPGAAVNLVVSSGAGGPPPDLVPGLATILVRPASATILTGQTQSFSATGILTSGAGLSLAGKVVWASTNPAVASIDAAGVATASSAGATTIRATNGAITGTATLIVEASVPNPTPPTAAITAPADQATVTGPVAVTGTASDPEFLKYRLEIALVGEENFSLLAEGTAPVSNGTLGTLDPTLLINDLYTLRLTVYDRGGNVARTEIQVQLAREQKVGHFTLAFQDLSVPMACMPLTVTRVYDSRETRRGDFGIGWRLDVQTLRLRETGTMGQGWAIDLVNRPGPFGIQIPTYVLYDTAAHKVSLTLPDGHVEEFDLTPSPSSSQTNPIGPVSLIYTPRPGTLGSLAPVIAGEFAPSADTGAVELIDSDVEILDSRVYRYTTPEGNVYLIDKFDGVQQVQCTNGQTLTFTPGGIDHSDGKGVAFTRDAEVRITTLTDPAGNVQRYAYDANGDLASHTDAEGQVTAMKYDHRHRLLEVIDPRGVRAVRNEYDADGRLASTTDPLGQAVTFDHDLVARTETVTDRLGHATVYEYDDKGNVLRQTDPLGGVTTRSYDAFGNELTRTDPLGRVTTLTYDSRRNPLTETNPLGHVTAYSYTALNAVRTVTDPLGRVTTNSYDANGNLTSTTDPAGGTTSYTYDARGLQTSRTDPLGQVTRYAYNSVGNLIQETDPLGHVSTYSYDANGNRLSETRTVGGETRITTFEYDGNNRLVRTTHPDGAVTRTEYNAIGKPARTLDALGRSTSTEYDDAGRLTRTVYPDGSSETSTYDAEGRRTASTDRAGRTTSYSYDALGRLVSTTFPDGASTATTYDAAGQVTASTDALGHTTAYQYDAAGRRTRVTDALGHVTAFSYDAAGNQTAVTDANGRVLSFTYDANNRRTRTTYPDGTADQVSYDALGRQIGKTDQAGQTTQYGYDPLGRLTRVTDALGQVTRYGYDEQGNQIEQTDANGHATTFGYDRMGRRTSRTLPLGMSETMSYDAAGNLTSKADFNGRTTTYGYDALNRLVEKRPDPATGEPAVGFTYTASGQRASMSDASGATTYAYDNRDRLTRKATPQGTLSYAYDAAGNLLSIQSDHAGGAAMSYAYDALNRLESVTDAHGATTYVYDAVGNLASYAYPNGVEHRYTYNPLNRLTDLAVARGATALARYTYTLGPAGNRLSVAELSGRVASYSYDALYRLTGETVSGDPGGVNGSIGYIYDPVGNRLTRSSTVAPIPAQTFGYDANDRITTEGYDANGNTLVTTEGRDFGYDTDNRLVSADGGVSFVYDGDGNRVSRTAGGVTTGFLVDTLNPTGYSQVLEEIENGVVVRRYTYGLDLVSQEQSSGVSFCGYDGHGSVRLLTDAAGTVTDFYAYDAFGNLTGQIGTTGNAYLYGGEQRDPTIGSYYLRSRYYSDAVGRFMTQDSILGSRDDPRTLSLYTYALMNPSNRVDPSGALSLTDVIATVAVIEILAATSPKQAWASEALTADPRVAFRKYAVGLSKDGTITACRKLQLMADKAGYLWIENNRVVSGLVNGLTEYGRYPPIISSDPNYRVGVLTGDPYYAHSFNTSGFKPEYSDPSNQVRHFTAFFAAGYFLGTVAATTELYIHEGLSPVINIPPRNNPDIALGLKAIELGVDFGVQHYSELSQAICRDVCE